MKLRVSFMDENEQRDETHLVESWRPTPPPMLLLWVLTLTRVTYLGRLDKVPVFLCSSNGESAVLGFSCSCCRLRSSLSFSSSSSMVPGRRNSFCGSSMPLASRVRMNLH